MKSRKQQPKIEQKNMSVLHGFSSGAGQPIQISSMQRKLGIEAHCIHIGANKMGFKYDKIIPDGSLTSRITLFNNLHGKYDAFHFYGFPFFGWKRTLNQNPFAFDLFMLKMLEKNVVMNFRGSEVRQKDIFEKHSNFSFKDGEDHGLFKNFPSEEQRRYIKICQAFVTSIIVPDVELGFYVPSAKVIPRAIDLSKWPFYGIQNEKRPLIVHAPTRRYVKGTDIVIAAINELKEKGLLFDFKLVEGLSNHEASEIYKQADIVIDQMRIGWHGVLSMEVMSLGKVAVCYIRNDLEYGLRYNGKMPLVNANPNNLTNILEELILNPSLRREIGNFARHYVEKIHDVKTVSKKFIKEYQKQPEPITSENIQMYQELVFEQQINLFKAQEELLEKLNIKSFNAFNYRQRTLKLNEVIAKLKEKNVELQKQLKPKPEKKIRWYRTWRKRLQSMML
jgi:glycosyltransferase involved in cell wall biosynthesis